MHERNSRTRAILYNQALLPLNFPRVTALHGARLYDTFVHALGQDKNPEGRDLQEDQYRHVSDLCDIPLDVTHIQETVVIYNDTTRVVCCELCSKAHTDICSSVLFDHRNQSCVLSAYTGSVALQSPGCGVATGTEFYRRIRRVGEARIELDNRVLGRVPVLKIHEI